MSNKGEGGERGQRGAWAGFAGTCGWAAGRTWVYPEGGGSPRTKLRRKKIAVWRPDYWCWGAEATGEALPGW